MEKPNTQVKMERREQAGSGEEMEELLNLLRRRCGQFGCEQVRRKLVRTCMKGHKAEGDDLFLAIADARIARDNMGLINEVLRKRGWKDECNGSAHIAVHEVSAKKSREARECLNDVLKLSERRLSDGVLGKVGSPHELTRLNVADGADVARRIILEVSKKSGFWS